MKKAVDITIMSAIAISFLVLGVYFASCAEFYSSIAEKAFIWVNAALTWVVGYFAVITYRDW